MKHLLLLSAVLIFCSASAQKQGQQLIDSLLAELPKMKDDSNKVKVLNRIQRIYMFINPREGFSYALLGLNLAEKINWKRGMANLHNDLGLMIGDTGNNTLARTHFEQSYAINKELGSKINQINNLNNIGRSYQRESDFSNASQYFFKALAIAEEIKDNEKIALVCTNLASSFLTQKNYAKATQYSEMALEKGELAKAPDQTGKALLFLGAIKQETKDTAAAKAYMERSLKIYEEMNYKPQMAQVLTSMADLESSNKKAIEILLRAQQIFDNISAASIGSIDNLANLGTAYYNLAMQSTPPEKNIYLKNAKEYLLRGVAMCKQASNTEGLAMISLSLAGVEETEGNYKKALDYYKTYSSINDSLFSQERKNEIAGLEEKRNIAIKDQEIAINKLMLSNQRRTQVGLIVGLLLAGTIAGLLYWQSRSRKKTNTTLMVLNNQLDEANKVKAKFFGILSHDLRSPIADLIHFLHLQKNDPELLNEEQQALHQQRISRSAENLLTNMESMLLWSKEQMENFKPHVKNVAVSDLFDYIQNFFGQPDRVSIRFSSTPGLEVSTDENYLRIIMQNLTSNAIKALKNMPDAVIEWKARKDGDKTVLSITDNGPGINDEQVKALYGESSVVNAKSGFGLHLIRDLARAIQYKISVQSNPGIGTTFVLSAA